MKTDNRAAGPVGKAPEERAWNDDKAWLHRHWSTDDRQTALDAIKDGVSQELRVRDHRCYQILMSGAVAVKTEDENGKESISVDPVKASQVHHGHDCMVETTRRWRTWVGRKPDPTKVYAWVAVIGDDDGKGSDGEPLCQEHGGHRDHHKSTYRTGFVDELPKWITQPSAGLCLGVMPSVPGALSGGDGSVWMAAETHAVIADPSATPEMPPPKGSESKGCPDCGGAVRGRGFTHARTCPNHKANKNLQTAGV